MTQSVKIKICGLSTPDTLQAALEAGADMVGFVFFPPSPRNIVLDLARGLGPLATGGAEKVALTVDADDALLGAIIDNLKPDMLQLHGKETPERLQALRQRFGLPLMKAIHISGKDDLGEIARYEGVADRLLFDARPPKDALLPGGNGAAFDWTILEGVKTDIPWMLSGGLDAGNVAEAIRMTGAPGVDVSSGVENAPGEKDVGQIRKFVKAARAAVL